MSAGRIGGVAARLAALCLDERGHLPVSDYADLGMRGALLSISFSPAG